MTTILITGASGGIGTATARALADRGADLIVHGSSMESAQHVAGELASSQTSVRPVGADFRHLAAVRDLGLTLADTPLDAVVHAAGVFSPEPARTDDGFDATWQINHLAPFLLTDLLLDNLAQNDGRAIGLAAALHAKGRLEPNGELAQGANPSEAYNASKLAMILAWREAARRLGGASPTLITIHPGVVETPLLTRFGFAGKGKGPAQIAAVLADLVLSPSTQASSGAYLDQGKPGRLGGPARSTDSDAAAYSAACRQTDVPGLPDVAAA